MTLNQMLSLKKGDKVRLINSFYSLSGKVFVARGISPYGKHYNKTTDRVEPWIEIDGHGYLALNYFATDIEKEPD